MSNPIQTFGTELRAIPPQAIDAEQAVLSACLLQNGYGKASEILKAEHFYQPVHQKIWEAIQHITGKGLQADLISVMQRLRDTDQLDGIGGPLELAKITNAVTGIIHVEHQAAIVLDRFVKREVIRLGAELVNIGYEIATDTEQAISEAETKVYQLSQLLFSADYKKLGDYVPDMISLMEKAEQGQTGVNTGFAHLNRITGGWQSTDLVIIAARPAVGKTAYALNLCRNAVHSGINVGFFSLEMGAVQLLQRMTAIDGRIMLNSIKTGRDLNRADFENTAGRIMDWKMYVDDTAGVTSFELRAKARRMVARHGVGLIVVDYLQLMTGEKTNNREQEISKISRELKKMAKDLKVPVIALSQLSREVEKRSVKVPVLADLRESGAIEQDADMVCFLHRPTDQDIERDPGLKNRANLKIAKHRNGELGEFTYRVTDSVQLWEELGKAGEVMSDSEFLHNYPKQDDLPF